VLPNEVWEHLNELFMEIKEELPGALNKRMRFKFLQKIIRGMQTLTGELEGTMSRNDAYTLHDARTQPRARRYDEPHH
jgi:uncharacterized alpha-E superfamily protein